MHEMEGGSIADRAIAAEYTRAIQQDQIAKLISFTTRPAIYAPLYNWLCELMSTVTMVRSGDLMEDLIHPPSSSSNRVPGFSWDLLMESSSHKFYLCQLLWPLSSLRMTLLWLRVYNKVLSPEYANCSIAILMRIPLL